MFAYVGTESWKPRGIDDLEPTAWEALRHSGSACVVVTCSPNLAHSV